MTEKAITQVGTISIACATSCGATDRVPAYEDKTEKDPERRIKPIKLAPYICLACHLAGWRAIGPVDQRNRFRVYNLDGREVAA